MTNQQIIQVNNTAITKCIKIENLVKLLIQAHSFY